MEIAIGLPSMIPGTDGRTVIDWARQAEERGFSSLGALDRLVYPGYEALVALAGAAAVTERIRLTTAVINGPYRLNNALLAKQALSVDALSGGRFVLGIGLGGRDDDYEASGAPTKGKGKAFDKQLDELRAIWNGEKKGYAGAIGPPPLREGGPELIVGGGAQASFERVARIGDGWMMGGGTPDQFAQGRAAVLEAWEKAEREGEPRFLGLIYYALGDGAEEHVKSDLLHYYAWLGDELAGMIAGSAATDAETVKQYIAAFSEVGCDELICFPTSNDLGQVGLLADAVL